MSYHLPVPEMAPKTSLWKPVSRKVLDLGGVIKVLVWRESSLPFCRTNKEFNESNPHKTLCVFFLMKVNNTDSSKISDQKHTQLYYIYLLHLFCSIIEIFLHALKFGSNGHSTWINT